MLRFIHYADVVVPIMDIITNGPKWGEW